MWKSYLFLFHHSQKAKEDLMRVLTKELRVGQLGKHCFGIMTEQQHFALHTLLRRAGAVVSRSQEMRQ